MNLSASTCHFQIADFAATLQGILIPKSFTSVLPTCNENNFSSVRTIKFMVTITISHYSFTPQSYVATCSAYWATVAPVSQLQRQVWIFSVCFSCGIPLLFQVPTLRAWGRESSKQQQQQQQNPDRTEQQASVTAVMTLASQRKWGGGGREGWGGTMVGGWRVEGVVAPAGAGSES